MVCGVMVEITFSNTPVIAIDAKRLAGSRFNLHQTDVIKARLLKAQGLPTRASTNLNG